MKKRETHIVKGMSRDLAVHRFDPNLVVDARNIRITTVKENSTLLSVTNEKGTSEFALSGDDIAGTIIGSAVLNNILVLFTTQGTTDRIYKLVFSSDYTSAVSYKLFEGTEEDSLNFDVQHPLETLPIYENEDIQKVYWVDGKNQPRVINVAKNNSITNGDLFNFNREIKPDYQMEITKYDVGGSFPAGTVQYCFNYFNKFGQETNIVDISPLYYLCPKDKGLPADAMSTSSFLIHLSHLDSNYEYVRIYAIVRTSENAVPNVRILGDYKAGIEKSVTEPQWIDGNTVDVSFESLYVIDGNTCEVVFKVSNTYPTLVDSDALEIPLESNEFLYDESTGKAYCYYSTRPIYGDFLKMQYINIRNSGGTIQIYDNSQAYKICESTVVINEESSISVVDNGVLGSTLDASALLFIGGQDIVAGTMTFKENTLFLGNIKQNVPSIGDLQINERRLRDVVRNHASCCVFDYEGHELNTFSFLPDNNTQVSKGQFYDNPIDNNRSSYQLKGFKSRENYRLGFIAQYKTGQWSEAVWIDDLDEDFAPGRNIFMKDDLDNLTWGPSYHTPGFKATISPTVASRLKAAGFIRIAPVVVYPSDIDKKVICQGIIASTVFNVGDRSTNSPFSQADWRFRMGYNWENIENEIQINYGPRHLKYPAAFDEDDNPVDTEDFVKYFETEYYRDPNILTFHSPDFQDDIESFAALLKDCKMRIVGITNGGLVNTYGNAYDVIHPKSLTDSSISLETEGYFDEARVLRDDQSEYDESLMVPRFEDVPMLVSDDTTWEERMGTCLKPWFVFYPDRWDSDSPRFWGIPEGLGGTAYFGTPMYRWYTYIWHRSGPLNCQDKLSAKVAKYEPKRTALFSKKCISEIKYGVTTFFQNQQFNALDDEPFSVGFDIEDLSVVSDACNSLINLTDSHTTYYPSVDKVLIPKLIDIPYFSGAGTDYMSAWEYGKEGYPIGFDSYYILDYIEGTGPSQSPADMPHYATRIHKYTGNDPNYAGEEKGFLGTDPVSMKYFTTPHLVFRMKDVDGNIMSLGEFANTANDTFTGYPYWKGTSQQTSIKKLPVVGLDTYPSCYGIEENSLFIGELYREFTPEREAARFNGTSESAILSNMWVRCGESIPLDSNNDNILYYREGDTYVGRFDFLKSYPMTDEDQNQFVSIYSTEIESRVNLDARYDKNRGLVRNLYVRPRNFNLFNHPGYEQSNQYFTYKTIDYRRYGMTSYPNMLTWSLEKRMGADIDTWTSIPMTSTADVRGDLGAITKLATFNDNIFAFQNRGIAQILFNERVQIPTSDGVPIEITNGMKYGGLRYITDSIGLSNKWSLCKTPNGLYFVDDERNTLYLFNGQQLLDLSSKHGMKTWFYAVDSHYEWNPEDYKNIRTFYDKVNGDVYFMTKEESLIFSEQVGAFISFMDYAGLPTLVNMNDKFLTFVKNPVTKLNRTWELFAGDFNNFFGTLRPYWLTFISNMDPTVDKVFDNLAWRTFDYSNVTNDFQGVLQPLQTFDHLRVWNDHQDSGEVALYDQEGRMTPILKKKFNVFRTLVPRDKLGNWKGKGFNRIRNTWSYIRLARLNPNEDLLMFSDLDVDFFE